LIKVLQTAYGIRCDADATFRAVVEKIAARRSQENHAQPAMKNS
jgi:hypothetical protein